ncbi:Pkinase-domain-containing protein [Backusella circina FSU 941]|nr:Pkinase-domain-containing protein [Backusella circina FSU 941]
MVAEFLHQQQQQQHHPQYQPQLQQPHQPQEQHKDPSVKQEKHATHSRDHQAVPLKAIGNYSFQQSLGKGSMGKVKLGVHNVTGEKVAVKIVPRANFHLLNQNLIAAGKSPQQIAKEKAREENREVRTIREAHIMMLLKHPNIVGLRDLVLQGPYFYILMDYCSGSQLLHYIVKRQRLSDNRTRHFARQIASSLDYLHRNSIVHRDLKIENIMVDKSGRNIKIIDFGLSNLFCPERQLTTYCGSLYFAAPELLKATPYNGPEVDIWSLGVVIYVMATGSVPFDDKSLPGLHDKIKKGQVNYPAHLTDELKDLLSRIFVVDPTQRIIMTDIMCHPWMLKDSPAINSHMPIRKPLTLPTDFNLIENMCQGFNLGAPDEIQRRLALIIQSPVYQNSINQIDEARKTQPSHGDSKVVPIYDDPQSVPAAYHPLLSLYYLSAERQVNLEYEAQHHRVIVKSSLSRSPSIGSIGSNCSSAPSSQTSLVDDSENNNSTVRRLLTEVPLHQQPILPAHSKNGSGIKLNANLSQPAAMGSTNYLSRIQRWLKSSLSQQHLHGNGDGTVSTPPSPPQQHDDSKHEEVDTLYVAQPEASSHKLPTPSSSTDDREGQSEKTNNLTVNDSTSKNSSNITVPQVGRPSLFRKLSQAFHRKGGSSKNLNKKTSNDTSTTTTYNDTEEDVEHLAVPAVVVVTNEPEVVVPPPVPPKDRHYVQNLPTRQSSLSKNKMSPVQQVPVGMSVATVTTRQNAHTVDINVLHKSSSFEKQQQQQQQQQQQKSDTLHPQTPTLSRSTSLASPRRRGSVSVMTGKIGTWLNRSTSFNNSNKKSDQGTS